MVSFFFHFQMQYCMFTLCHHLQFLHVLFVSFLPFTLPTHLSIFIKHSKKTQNSWSEFSCVFYCASCAQLQNTTQIEPGVAIAWFIIPRVLVCGALSMCVHMQPHHKEGRDGRIGSCDKLFILQCWNHFYKPYSGVTRYVFLLTVYWYVGMPEW